MNHWKHRLKVVSLPLPPTCPHQYVFFVSIAFHILRLSSTGNKNLYFSGMVVSGTDGSKDRKILIVFYTSNFQIPKQGLDFVTPFLLYAPIKIPTIKTKTPLMN